MLAQGADINSVSKRLGHSKVSTTLDVYAHAYERSQQEAANKLGASIAEAVLEHRREASA